MKTLTYTLVLGAAFALAVSSAKAAVGVSVNNTPLNVSISVTTNTPSKTSGNTTTWSTKTVKVSNKDLIKLFQHWSTNAWSLSGAKLVIGWDWDGDVLVVDKTGTNVLFDASSGSETGDNAYFTVDFYDETGADKGKSVDNSPGSYGDTEMNAGDFTLYDNDVYLPYTYLTGYGSSMIGYTQSWDKNGDYSKWKASAQYMNPAEGYQYFLGANEETSDNTMSASIKSSGSGKGLNSYFY